MIVATNTTASTALTAMKLTKKSEKQNVQNQTLVLQTETCGNKRVVITFVSIVVISHCFVQ